MRILVTAGTGPAAVPEIAVEVGKELRGALPGTGVDVVPLERVARFAGYDAVVLGAPVPDFHLTALRDQPVWLFSLGGAPGGGTELARAVGARDHVVFRDDPTEPGGFRDWPAVREWVDRIAVQLRTGRR